MVFGCCTSIDNYGLLVRHGYDRIILSAVELMAMDGDDLSRTVGTLGAGPVKCRALNSFCLPCLKLCGAGYDPDAVSDYCAALSARAHLIGAEYIGVGAPKSRNIPEGFPKETAEAQFTQSLEILCKACAPYGMTVLLEALCSLECNHVTTTDEAYALVKALREDNLALVFDTYHAFMMDEDARPLSGALDAVKLVHMAQNIDGRRHFLREENVPEYRVYTDALLLGGYDGEVSVEAFYDDMEPQLDETLRIMRSLCLKQHCAEHDKFNLCYTAIVSPAEPQLSSRKDR